MLFHAFHQLAAKRFFGAQLESCCLKCCFDGLLVHALWDYAKRRIQPLGFFRLHPSGRNGRIHQHGTRRFEHARTP